MTGLSIKIHSGHDEQKSFWGNNMSELLQKRQVLMDSMVQNLKENKKLRKKLEEFSNEIRDLISKEIKSVLPGIDMGYGMYSKYTHPLVTGSGNLEYFKCLYEITSFQVDNPNNINFYYITKDHKWIEAKKYSSWHDDADDDEFIVDIRNLDKEDIEKLIKEKELIHPEKLGGYTVQQVFDFIKYFNDKYFGGEEIVKVKNWG